MQLLRALLLQMQKAMRVAKHNETDAANVAAGGTYFARTTTTRLTVTTPLQQFKTLLQARNTN